MAASTSDEGASTWQQLLYAAKTDSVELCEECLKDASLDVNRPDGLGMTALHHAVKSPSPEVLELLLDDERTDVDPTTKLDGDTPLHLAVKLDDPSARSWMVKTLLEAGADPRIRNKYKDKPVDLLPKHATSDDLREDFRKAEAETAIDASDVAKEDEDSGEEGGQSGEE